MIICPPNCAKRSPTCHASCADYAAAVATHQAQVAAQRRASECDRYEHVVRKRIKLSKERRKIK